MLTEFRSNVRDFVKHIRKVIFILFTRTLKSLQQQINWLLPSLVFDGLIFERTHIAEWKNPRRTIKLHSPPAICRNIDKLSIKYYLASDGGFQLISIFGKLHINRNMHLCEFKFSSTTNPTCLSSKKRKNHVQTECGGGFVDNVQQVVVMTVEVVWWPNQRTASCYQLHAK